MMYGFLNCHGQPDGQAGLGGTSARHEMVMVGNTPRHERPESRVFARVPVVTVGTEGSSRDVKRVMATREDSLFTRKERPGETTAILSGSAANSERHGVIAQGELMHTL